MTRKVFDDPESMVVTTIRWPKDLINKIDRQRGMFLSRNMQILKMMQEHLAENELQASVKDGRGAEVASRARQQAEDEVTTATIERGSPKEIGVNGG